MKKTLLAVTIIAALASCKNEKPAVVGTNDQGQELVVNAQGDTVVYVAPAQEESTSLFSAKKEEAFEKADDGTYTFHFNLKKGDAYPFNIVTTSNASQSDGKQTVSGKQESTTSLEYKVAEVKDSTFVLDVTYKRFAESFTENKKTVGYDTNIAEPTDKEAQQRWRFNKAIIGKTFQMEIDKNGKVKNISNLWKVRDQVKNDMKAIVSAEELKGVEEYLKMALSDEEMTTMFEESIAYYPKKAVKPGETWSKDDSGPKGKSKINYTFEGVNGDVATIKISGTSNGSETEKDPKGSGASMTRTLNGQVNGTVNINKTSGWLNNATMNKTETVKITRQYKEQKMNLTSETKSTTKIN